MTMTLYQIDAAIENLIDPETGEIIDDAAFDALEMERDTKLENTALYAKNMKALIAAITAEKQALDARLNVAKNTLIRLETLLSDHLGGQKFETPKVKISYRNSERVEIENLEEFIHWAERWNDSLLKYKSPEPDKTVIKLAIKNGFTIKGAELVKCANMQIK